MNVAMQNIRRYSNRLRQFIATASISLAAIVASAPVLAQQVVVVVNGDPITTYDVDQRMKFNQLTTHKVSPRQEVVEELINEKLKVQFGKRYKLEVSDKDVESAFADMSKRMRLTPQQLTQALAQAGVDATTLKSRLRSDIAWMQIVRGKYQSSLQIREKDIHDVLETRKAEDKEEVGYEYALRPILFIVPPGSHESDIEARRREAEALRNRFLNCNDGLPVARALRNVVVRDQITRNSADLAPPLRKILDETTVGRLTNPEITPQGVEIFALCSRKETKIETAAKRQIRDDLFAEQFQAKSKRLLQELRRGAMIEVK